MANPNPWMKAVTATTSAQKLLTLMQARDSGCPTSCKELHIELDISTSATDLYVGNSDVSASNFGQHLVPSNFRNIGPVLMNGVDLSAIYLLSVGASAAVGITAYVE